MAHRLVNIGSASGGSNGTDTEGPYDSMGGEYGGSGAASSGRSVDGSSCYGRVGGASYDGAMSMTSLPRSHGRRSGGAGFSGDPNSVSELTELAPCCSLDAVPQKSGPCLSIRTIVLISILTLVIIWTLYIAVFIYAKSGEQFSSLMLGVAIVVPVLTMLYCLALSVILSRRIKNNRNSKVSTQESSLAELRTENDLLRSDVERLKCEVSDKDNDGGIAQSGVIGAGVDRGSLLSKAAVLRDEKQALTRDLNHERSERMRVCVAASRAMDLLAAGEVGKAAEVLAGIK